MSTRAKVTLAASIVLSSFIIWGVHYQQNKEHEDMYQGVLRDDERRREKMKQRQEEFEDSQRKRAIYERTQSVVPGEGESR